MSRADFLDEPGHEPRIRGRVGREYYFGCSCGWFGRCRNENALARNSRMVGQFNDHIRALRGPGAPGPMGGPGAAPRKQP